MIVNQLNTDIHDDMTDFFLLQPRKSIVDPVAVEQFNHLRLESGIAVA